MEIMMRVRRRQSERLAVSDIDAGVEPSRRTYSAALVPKAKEVREVASIADFDRMPRRVERVDYLANRRVSLLTVDDRRAVFKRQIIEHVREILCVLKPQSP